MKRLSFYCALGCLFSVLGGLFAEDAKGMFVDIDGPRRPISPWIYGTNADLPAQEGITARRFGGNRSTAFNWETGASNAGVDWKNSSDNWWASTLGVGAGQRGRGAVLSFFHEKSLQLKAPYTLITLPMAGYVAADMNGEVSRAEAAPSARWRAALPARDSSLTRLYKPSELANAVYAEDEVSWLVERYGPASSPRGVRAYELDNEPALWSMSHPLVHPKKVNCAEVLERGLETARVVKRIDPSAEVLGPESFGYAEMLDNAGAEDWPDCRDSNADQEAEPYRWYLDWYLDNFRKASQAAGTRLLNALSIHWYPETRGGADVRITAQDASDVRINRARVQAPRQLWDEGYFENSWLASVNPSPFPLIPALKKSIDAWYPGTGMAFTEYNFGGDDHVSGGIAEADALGIFGKYGVYLATYWPVGGRGSYVSAALRIFRNADGRGLCFGDQSLETENPLPKNASLYASIESQAPGRLHLVIINKDEAKALASPLDLRGKGSYRLLGAWGFTSAAPRLESMASAVSVQGKSLSFTLPPLSVIHILLEASPQ
jgi:mannan endo-1,4-beta-mannosidase